MSKNTAVCGIYSSHDDLGAGLTALRNSGFRTTDISLLVPENLGNKDLAHEKSSKSPEGAAAGAASGAILGGAIGWLVGIGSLAIPGLGPLIAAGPIVAALAGVGAGATALGCTGALIGLGIPEYEAKRYEGRVRSGGLLVSVHCDNSDWDKLARVILERTGAQDISSTTEAPADYAKTERPIPR